jgi:hypothetical protein
MDQINNLQSGLPSKLPPVSKLQTSSKKQQEVETTDLSFDTLLRRLQEMPEVRDDVVEKGKALLDDPEYPGPSATRTLAQNLINNRIV